MLTNAVLASATASSLLMAKMTEGTRSSLSNRLWRRVCGSRLKPGWAQSTLVASTNTTAASALDAAVTMLRVYCS